MSSITWAYLLRVIAGSEWPSPPFAPIRDPVGVNRGVESPADPRKPFIYGPEGLGRPVSRILLYPAIHLRGFRAPGSLGEPRLPARRRSVGTIWLARTGGLPGRSLAGYRRWALTPPFHPSPVPEDTPLRSASFGPSAGLLSVALDVTGGLRRPASLGSPRPSGSWPERPLL